MSSNPAHNYECYHVSYQAGDHFLSLFTQSFNHLENIYQLLILSTVQQVPQSAENPWAGGAIAEEETNTEGHYR